MVTGSCESDGDGGGCVGRKVDMEGRISVTGTVEMSSEKSQ